MIWLTVILILVLLMLAVSYFAYRKAFFSPEPRGEEEEPSFPGYVMFRDRIRETQKDVEKLSPDTVEIRSFDGLTLRGYYVHFTDGAPVLIFFHGYRSTPLRFFGPFLSLYRSLGFNLLLAEQRGCGRSEGHVITFGVLERQDCLAWANYVSERFTESRILLGGISMGGATVLMASDLALPENVAGIISDCPYAAPRDIILRVAGKGRPAGYLFPCVAAAARLFGHFSVTGASAVESVKKARVPILLLHGEADTFVPCDMSRAIHAAAPDRIELHTVPGGEHAFCRLTDPETYDSCVRAFAQRVLRPAEGSHGPV